MVIAARRPGSGVRTQSRARLVAACPNPLARTCPMASADAAQRRLRREMKTVRAMIALYCRDRHGTRRDLCRDCCCLWGYAQRRVDRCPFRGEKPTCVSCTVHCYSPAMRDRIREVMRYAGPRMIWRHPVLALWHFIDGRQPPGDPRGRSSEPLS